MPSTLFGALCTAIGRAHEAKLGRRLTSAEWQDLADKQLVLDATLAVRRPVGRTGSWLAADRVWPVPADTLFVASPDKATKSVRHLDPRAQRVPTLGRDDDPAREALSVPCVDAEATGKPTSGPSWWSEDVLLRWLTDPAQPPVGTDAFTGLALPRHVQAHVGIDPATATARDAILFAHDVVETLDAARAEWAIACRIETTYPLPAGWITLGGDRRPARLELLPNPLFACPETLFKAFAKAQPRGLRLVAMTPASFKGGWLPDGFSAADGCAYRGHLPNIAANLVLRAAFIRRAGHVSGWDMALGAPKPTTRLVPPGSVYCFEKADGTPFSAEEARRLWLAPLGERTRQGLGSFVPGLWHPIQEKS